MAEVGSQRKHNQFRKDLHDVSTLIPESLGGVLPWIWHTQFKKAKTTVDKAKGVPPEIMEPLRLGFTGPVVFLTPIHPIQS